MDNGGAYDAPVSARWECRDVEPLEIVRIGQVAGLRQTNLDARTSPSIGAIPRALAIASDSATT